MHLPTVSYCALHIPWTFQTKHVPRLSPSFSPDTATWVYHLIFNDSSVYWGTLVWDLEPDIPHHSPHLCLLTDLPLCEIPYAGPLSSCLQRCPHPGPGSSVFICLLASWLLSTSSAWLAHSPQGSFSCIDSATLWYKSLSMTHCHL